MRQERRLKAVLAQPTWCFTEGPESQPLPCRATSRICPVASRLIRKGFRRPSSTIEGKRRRQIPFFKNSWDQGYPPSSRASLPRHAPSPPHFLEQTHYLFSFLFHEALFLGAHLSPCNFIKLVSFPRCSQIQQGTGAKQWT